jgi:hypothetical protein
LADERIAEDFAAFTERAWVAIRLQATVRTSGVIDVRSTSDGRPGATPALHGVTAPSGGLPMIRDA